MKKGLLVGIVLIIGLIGVFAMTSVNKDETIGSGKQIQQRTDIPVKLIIPKLSINTNIESVGLDSKKAMDVPKDVNNVGWYSLGFRPGEKGNSVLAGHFDDRNGNPAIFYHLKDLKPGDEIITEDSKQLQYHYIVTMIQTYKHNDVPIEQVFGDFPISRLNLITCTGTWDATKSIYLERVVVYSRLNKE